VKCEAIFNRERLYQGVNQWLINLEWSGVNPENLRKSVSYHF